MKAEGSALSSAGSYHRLAYHEVINDDNQNKIFTSDDSRLRQLGYKQELYRGLSGTIEAGFSLLLGHIKGFIANFSFTFAIVSVLTGISTLYNQALTFGGPITLVYGWPIVSLMTLIVGLAMAEICSAYPTSAGLYYWSAKLSGNYFGPFASWITGWYILFFSALVVPFLPKKNFSYFRIP